MSMHPFGHRRFPVPLLLGVLSLAPLWAQAAPLTEKDTLVLADFDNRTGEPTFDVGLKEALILELEQSPFLNLLPDRKLSEALRAMGRKADAPVTMDAARELCQKVGGKAVLGGTISRSSGHYLLQLTAIDCGSGAVLAQEEGDAVGEDGVLPVLSQASSKLRLALGEPAHSVQAFEVPVETTTHSLEALKTYRLGAVMRNEKGDTASIPLLKYAIELDPDFPLPYGALAAIYGNIRQPTQAVSYAGKAYALRGRASERESLQLAGIYFLETGDLQKEIENYKLWQGKYPRDSVARNNLGNDYAQMGRLEEGLAEYQQALQLTPSVITYTNVLGMEISLNRFAAAQATLDEAFARGLDGRYLHQNQYWLAFLRGNAAQMKAQLAWAMGKPGDEDTLLSMDSDTEAYYGRVESARRRTQQSVDSAIHAGYPETAALWQVNAALREAEWGDFPAARAGVDKALKLSQGRDVKLIAAFTLARTGDSQRVKALVQELKRDYPTDSLLRLYWLSCIDAAAALDIGDAKRALVDLKTAEPYELGGANTFINYLYPAYLRGQAYLLAHDGAAAAAEFQKLPDHSGVVTNFVTGALAHLELGRAYALAGDATQAKTAYQDFFRLWKQADPSIPVLLQAKAEYANLP